MRRQPHRHRARESVIGLKVSSVITFMNDRYQRERLAQNTSRLAGRVFRHTQRPFPPHLEPVPRGGPIGPHGSPVQDRCRPLTKAHPKPVNRL